MDKNSYLCQKSKSNNKFTDEKSSYIFLLIVFGEVHGQDNYKKGYIITNDRDTLVGWIDFRTDARNMRICNFKTRETGKIVSYLPKEIYGYRFYQEGKFYVSKEVTVNDEQRTVFLEYLVQGIMSLYYYVELSPPGQKMKFYFFEDEVGNITPVTKKTDRQVDNNKGYIEVYEDFHYKGVIKYLFKDLETISKEVDKLPFDQKSMINITKEYHAQVCITGEECVIYETKKDKAYNLFKFSVYGGIQLASEKPLGRTTFPVIGVGLNVSVPRFNKNLSFQVNLAFSKIHKTVSFDEKNSPECHYEYVQGALSAGGQKVWGCTEYLSRVKSNCILVPLQLSAKYSLGQYKIRPIFEGGLSLTSSYINNYTLNYTYTRFASNPGTEFSKDPYSVFMVEVGFLGALELAYLLTNKYSIFINSGCIVSAMGIFQQFKLGFTF
ncbi:MAG: hypothetical protein LBH91_04910 [Prevotellaceae bacterium]|jgi:hypothetical protein|nr:hypothetical protein [Prevotellaceae bacterium]